MIGTDYPRVLVTLVVIAGFLGSAATVALSAVIPLTFAGAKAGDCIGARVAISGNTVLVGSPYGGTASEGEVHVFVETGGIWEFSQTLSVAGTSQFGAGLDVDGNAAIVGAYGSNKAFVYGRSVGTWTNAAELQGTSGFGYDVGIGGEMAVIGTYDGPSAHAFTSGDNWDQGTTLGTGAYFGHSIDISGTTAVVGDYWTDTAHFYHYDGSNWNFDGSVSHGNGDQFGYSVAIDGDYAIVGANQTDAGTLSNTGSATIYRRQANGSWAEQVTLAPSGLYRSDEFGYSVAISGDTAVIGAVNKGPLGRKAGTVYVYQGLGTTWKLAGTLQPEEGTNGDQFGCSVAIDGDTIVVGAWHEDIDDGANDNAGAAYIFDVPTLSVIPGDANWDNLVNETDAQILATHWGLSGMTWSEGDFDGDDLVGPADASILAAHWGATAQEATPMPEPTLAVLLFSLALLAIWRRRR